MVFILRCPSCANTMKYMPSDMKDFSAKSKRCVFCGRNFKVKERIVSKA